MCCLLKLWRPLAAQRRAGSLYENADHHEPALISSIQDMGTAYHGQPGISACIIKKHML